MPSWSGRIGGSASQAYDFGERSSWDSSACFHSIAWPVYVTMRPRIAIIVLRASRVVGWMEAAWALIRAENRDETTGGFMPRNIMWVTGPSRSADIESTLELGAHGPRRLHVVLIDDDPDALA